jgi:site-specific recombinase XerD
MKQNQTLSILIWAFKRKASDKVATLYARITVAGKRSEISLSRKIDLSLWDETAGLMKVKSDQASEINEYLEIVRGELRQCFYELKATGKEITSETIKNKYLRIEDTDAKTLLGVFHLHNTEMKSLVGKGVSDGTYKRYLITIGKLKRFLKEKYKRSDILLRELKYGFLTDFDFFLKTTDNLDHNTSLIYLKKIKKIVSLSVKNDWIPKNPFEAYKCSETAVHRDVLNDEELRLLQSKVFHSHRLGQVRDIFLFSCYTGLAYAETNALTKEHLENRPDGEKWILINRKKTNGRSEILLLPIPLQLIEKYKNHPECVRTGKLFPVKSNQKYNDYLKEVADLCGIKKKLTTHIARHTFATTITLANDVPIESVSAMLGHKSIRTTQVYAKVVQKKLSNNMKVLRSKLNNDNPMDIQKY